MQNIKFKKISIFMAFVLVLTSVFWCVGGRAGSERISWAKSQDSSSVENVFIYANDSQGKSVLIKIIPISEVEAMAHGSGSNANYYISSIDNYPTTQYCEAVGVTIPELLAYAASKSTVKGASDLKLSGSDSIKFMAGDSYGKYVRTWKYADLYETDRYYFEKLYDENSGWKSEWEVNDEAGSKTGMTLEEYNKNYKASDKYYNDKISVLKTGEKSTVILATKSYSGRTAIDALNSSSEIGIASYIKANGGKAAGCLKNQLESETALRLCIPQSEADLMCAHRTTYDQFRWIYNMCFETASAKNIASAGTVAKTEGAFTPSSDGSKITVTLTCPTQGASIYYSLNGSPQTLYTGPFTYDTEGADLSANPAAIYAASVKEGCDDAGVTTLTYPAQAPSFQSTDGTVAGEKVTFTAAEAVTQAEWDAWVKAVKQVKIKTPDGSDYTEVPAGKYTFDSKNRTLTFDGGLFTKTGSYMFTVNAASYADKNLSITAKSKAPALTLEGTWTPGSDLVIKADDPEYLKYASVYAGKEKGETTMISSSYIDTTQSGKLVVKAGYFSQDSSVVKEPGTYVIELTNNLYNPSTQQVKITVPGAASETGDSSGTGLYSDVKDSSWYHDAVAFVTEKNLFTGTGASTFSPGISMTRGMFVTVLGRAYGINAGDYSSSSFSDVKTGSWYAPYVEWASKEGIVSGTGNGCFEPNKQITRQEMAVMLYNYVAFVTKSGKAASGTSTTEAAAKAESFPDAGDVSSWAEDAMEWALSKGIINGSDGKLLPKSQATRAQVAQIIKNCYDKIGEDFTGK